MGMHKMQPKLRTFGGEKFTYAGSAKSLHNLKVIQVKILKDGCSFRYEYKDGLWLTYKKKKKYHKNH